MVKKTDYEKGKKDLSKDIEEINIEDLKKDLKKDLKEVTKKTDIKDLKKSLKEVTKKTDIKGVKKDLKKVARKANAEDIKTDLKKVINAIKDISIKQEDFSVPGDPLAKMREDPIPMQEGSADMRAGPGSFPPGIDPWDRDPWDPVLPPIDHYIPDTFKDGRWYCVNWRSTHPRKPRGKRVYSRCESCDNRPPPAPPPPPPPPQTNIVIYCIGGASGRSTKIMMRYANKIKNTLKNMSELKPKYVCIDVRFFSYTEKKEAINCIKIDHKRRTCYKLLVGYSFGGAAALEIAYKPLHGNNSNPVATLINDIWLIDPVSHWAGRRSRKTYVDNIFSWKGWGHFKIKFVRPAKFNGSDVLARLGGWWSESKWIINKVLYPLGYRETEADLIASNDLHHNDLHAIMDKYFLNRLKDLCVEHYKATSAE